MISWSVDKVETTVNKIADVSDRPVRIQFLRSATGFLEILFTDAAQDYIKCFYITENSAAALRFAEVSGKKRLPGRFVLAKALLSLVFFCRLSFI